MHMNARIYVEQQPSFSCARDLQAVHHHFDLAEAEYGFWHLPLQELGNYAEYSGAPSTAETYVFAKTLLNWCENTTVVHVRFRTIAAGVVACCCGRCCYC